MITEIEKLNFYGWTKDGMKENPDIPIEDAFLLRKDVLALQNKVSDVSAEKILDKHYESKMHWKSVNRENVLNAMEEYASIVNKTGGKGYEFFKGELLVKCDRLLRDKGMSSADTNECLSLAIDDLKEVFNASIVNERKAGDVSSEIGENEYLDLTVLNENDKSRVY